MGHIRAESAGVSIRNEGVVYIDLEDLRKRPRNPVVESKHLVTKSVSTSCDLARYIVFQGLGGLKRLNYTVLGGVCSIA